VNNDYLASYLALGDNFAVNAKGVDFFILMCTNTFCRNLKSVDGQQFNVGDTVVASRYYQKWGQS
jgi:hypothetical protein